MAKSRRKTRQHSHHGLVHHNGQLHPAVHKTGVVLVIGLAATIMLVLVSAH